MVPMTNFARIIQLPKKQIELCKQSSDVGEELQTNERRLLDESPFPSANAPKTPANAIRTLRVLVVDDNRDSAETMGMLLEIEGHEILIAHDGKQAVEIALAQQPDAILLDLGLPFLNGYDACRAMRTGGLTNTLIVAMTGYGQDEDRRLSQEAGFDAYLVKPVDLLAVRELLAGQI